VRAPFTVGVSDLPLVTTAVHAGHDLRPEVADRIGLDEGTRRREDIEAVIADLVRRRDDVLTDTEELVGKLSTAVNDHRPPAGEDPFDRPDDLDPEQRVDAEADEDLADEAEGDDEDAGEDEAEDAEPEDEEESDGAGDETAEAPKRRRRGRARA